MTTTKAHLVENVYEAVGGDTTRRDAAEFVDAVFDAMKETLMHQRKLKLSGFGNFVVRDKNSRTGRDPQTGKAITIGARRVVTFKPSQTLRDRINE